MSIVTANNLDDIITMNKAIRKEVERNITSFEKSYNIYSILSPEKAAFEILKKHHLIQVPIEDKYWGGAIRKLSSGLKIPVINTAQPRLYQYFTYFHELYHLLFDEDFNEANHNISVDLDIAERKADYFAANILMSRDTYHYFLSLGKDTDFYHKIAMCMDSYKAPYKAILIQLYESAYDYKDEATRDIVKKYFDHNVNTEEWYSIFEELSLDSAVISPSYLLNFGDLEKYIQKAKNCYPDASYHEDNHVFFLQLKEKFEALRESKP